MRKLILRKVKWFIQGYTAWVARPGFEAKTVWFWQVILVISFWKVIVLYDRYRRYMWHIYNILVIYCKPCGLKQQFITMAHNSEHWFSSAGQFPLGVLHVVAVRWCLGLVSSASLPVLGTHDDFFTHISGASAGTAGQTSPCLYAASPWLTWASSQYGGLGVVGLPTWWLAFPVCVL